VRTGRGADLTDITPEQYERVLTYLAKVQTVPPLGPGGPPDPPRSGGFEDPWSAPVGRVGDLLIRAKCAPHFRRIIWELDPTSRLLGNYAHGACPAGKYYCRITPDGDVTPCPYMPVSAGNLRRASFADIWRGAPVLEELRERRLGGRCGACEFSKICGGCRCRAYATSGDYLAEDPACAYQPGAHGGQPILDLGARGDARDRVGGGRPCAAPGRTVVRARHGGEGGRGVRPWPGAGRRDCRGAGPGAGPVGRAVPPSRVTRRMPDDPGGRRCSADGWPPTPAPGRRAAA